MIGTLEMDGREFRNALGSFVTGVTVITTRDAQGVDFGVTANSFNSVSLDPPLVLWSLARSSASLAAFANAERFAIHVLASDQVDISARFARRGADKFAGLAFERGDGGVPLLPDCSARFLCRPAYTYEGGDHIIFVGEVLEFDHRPRAPLAFHAGTYASTTRHSDTPDPLAGSLTHLIQSCYFHLLTPVREERARLSIGLAEHYFLNLLFSRETLSINDANAIIGYTGVQVTEAHARMLASRGFVKSDGDASSATYVLLDHGRAAVLALVGAAAVKESDLHEALNPDELAILKTLLHRAAERAALSSPEEVHQHMAALRELTLGAE
jgi:3-hydroxy-9,10-secoandrosta-1,3,5(10)-triene-9,17-dione monooxygenase reductase component